MLAGKRGWKSEPIFDAIAKHNRDNSIVYAGYLTRAEAITLLKGAHACLYPSLYEGFGLPVLEAMACRCPVVTSNASSIPEVVEDCGLMASPDDIEAHAKHLDQILTDDEFAESLRQRGLNRARQLTWTHCAERTLQTYMKVAA